jgi:hypothetical protein
VTARASGLFLASVVFVLACASTAPNFSKPKLEWMKFGQTSRADIVARYGPPEREVQFTRNGQVVSQLNFRYVATFGSDAEKRRLGFYLAGDRVVGYEFGDSFMDQETDFDSKKVGTVAKGVTTREQVLSLFGNPLGVLAYPATTQDETAAGDFVFLYAHRSSSGGKVELKRLRVTIGGDNLVKDLNFNSRSF